MTPAEWLAEEIDAVCGLGTRSLVDAFARTPRERFLGPGPWTIAGEGKPRMTADADPRRVHHNVSVALDLSRQLFNGAPGVLATWLDALQLAEGSRMLHVGCGTGYYSAVAAQVLGPSGAVEAIEIDEGLAARARAVCAAWPWIDVRCGHGHECRRGPFEAILVNAGVTHPAPAWLEALAPAGRMVLPITVAMPPGAPVGKGAAFLVTRTADGFTARALSMTMIYNAVGLRDPSIEAAVARAFARGALFRVARLRIDDHPESTACCLHTECFCLTAG